MIFVPVSLGELVDKITILKIKLVKIQEPSKLQNVQKEYDELTKILNSNSITEEHPLFKDLLELNMTFWEYHDWQREQWKKSNDNLINIELYKKTREEHILNDRRAEIKKQINTLFKSEIVEEKQFISYNI
jgi:hypothetical protein